MSNTLMQILPLVGMFILGVALRRFGLVQERYSSWILRFVFYVILPAIIFLAVMKITLDSSVIFLAIFPPVIMSVTIAVTLILRKSILRSVKTKTFASLLAGAAITNQGFLVPFVGPIYGSDGLARLAIIDCFTVIMIFSLIYGVVAIQGHGHHPKKRTTLYKVLSAPALWAFIVGLTFRLSGGRLPSSIMNLFPYFALSLALILLLVVGIKFRPHLKNPLLFFIEIGLRFLLGAVVGVVFVKLFQLQGVDAQIILIASMAPIGMNSITLAEVEKLDVDFAVSSVTSGLLIGLIVTPFVVHFVSGGAW